MKWNLIDTHGHLDVPKEFSLKVKKHYKRFNKIPVVLLDMGVPGLAFARHLGRRGVPIVALDTKLKHWTHNSKYIYSLVSTRLKNSDELLSVLTSISALFPDKPIIIPLHDDYVKFVASNRKALEDTYRLIIPDEKVTESLVDKRKLYLLCKKYDVPVPATIFPEDISNLKQQLPNIRFPCIIKPAESRSWQTEQAQKILYGRKAIRVENKEDLINRFKQLSKIDPRLLIQDLIQGPDENLYYIVLYVDKTRNILGNFVGQKLRTYPAHFGRGSYVRSVFNISAVEMASKIVKKLNYHGNIGVELKLDEQDGQYKLIEINARFGLWDGFASDCDMDLVYAAYADATDTEFQLNDSYELNRYWLNLEIDYKAALQYYRMGELTIIDWLRSILTSNYSAITAKDDIKPAVIFWIGTGKYLIWRAMSRLRWM